MHTYTYTQFKHMHAHTHKVDSLVKENITTLNLMCNIGLERWING